MSAIAQLRAREDGSPDSVLLNAAVQACPESMAIVEDGRLLYANRAFAQMFGYHHPSQVRGRPVLEIVPGDNLWTGSNARSADRRGTIGDGHFFFEFSAAGDERIRTQIEASYVGFRVDDRSLLVLSTRDVSQRKQVEWQLRDSQRMEAVGRLVGGVAHDFNNLLTGIMLYCDLLIAGLDGNTGLRRHAEQIRRAGENSRALIQQLLALARRRVVEPRLLVWNQVVCDMRDFLARLIGEDIELEAVLASDLGRVSLDPAQAQQIVLNLVLNARDAMPEGGRVTLQTRNCGVRLTHAGHPKPCLEACVEFIVADTGCGMDAEARSHLFEPFFTSKEPGRGTGLGLATVHNITKQAGGTIEVQSESGKGTRVSVCLPRIDDRAPISEPRKKRC